MSFLAILLLLMSSTQAVLELLPLCIQCCDRPAPVGRGMLVEKPAKQQVVAFHVLPKPSLQAPVYLFPFFPLK